MKTMTTSEFATYIINRFANAIRKNEIGTFFNIFKADGYDLMRVNERKSGKSQVYIKGVSYSKMTATEKKEALDFVNTIQFDRVEIRDVIDNSLHIHNYICGIYTEGQEIPVVGSKRIWLRVEKVTRIQ